MFSIHSFHWPPRNDFIKQQERDSEAGESFLKVTCFLMQHLKKELQFDSKKCVFIYRPTALTLRSWALDPSCSSYIESSFNLALFSIIWWVRVRVGTIRSKGVRVRPVWILTPTGLQILCSGEALQTLMMEFDKQSMLINT